MAFYTQSQGQMQEIMGLLKRRIWQIVLPAIVTGALGVMAASLMPRKYEATTQLELVNVPVPMVAAGLQPDLLKSNIWAAEFHIKSAERLRRVIESLEWEDFQTLPPDQQRRYLKRVMANLKVKPFNPANTNATFLDLKYFDADPQRAAAFLNEVRDVYVSEKVENVRQTAVKARDKLQEQLKDSQADYDDKFNKAQELRRQNSLSPTQQAPGGGRTRDEDPVYSAYIRLGEELDKVRNQRIKTEQIRASTQELYENEPKEIADTTITPGVNLAAELVDIEREIAELRASQQGLRPAHSQFQKAEKEIARLESKREQLQGRSTSTTTEIIPIPNPKKKALLDRLDDLDVDIAGFKAAERDMAARIEEDKLEVSRRGEIYSRLSWLDNAQKMAATQLDQANIAFTRQRNLVDMLNQPEFSPFEVTEYALPPSRPSSPNVPLVVIGAMFVGLIVGLLAALVAEFGRNAFRGPADIGQAITAPVLGAVNAIVTSGQRRNSALRRAVVGVSTLIVAGAILWVTWAYENRPRMLGQDLTRFLDEIRAQLR